MAKQQKKLGEILVEWGFIQPKEVAAAVLLLCSEAAGSVTGQALSLSGGETW